MSYLPIEELELRLNALTSDIDVWYGGSLSKDEYNKNPSQKGLNNATHQIYSSDVVGGGISYFIKIADRCR